MDTDTAFDCCDAIIDTVSESVVVERDTLETLLAGFLARGHVLLEDVPGTGKTLTARTLAGALGLSFSRIQFTPDLLPADVTGTYVYDEGTGSFEFRAGPIFGNIVLADELNRASPKTQAALLEAMAEGQVTVEGRTHDLPDPFFVIATQNPIEQDGTFPLPEAQIDRFILKTSIGYPEESGERMLIDRRADRSDRTPNIGTEFPADPSALRNVPETVYTDDAVREYLVALARETRTDSCVSTGVSPRGTQRLFEAARALAVIRGRAYVTPDHITDIAPAVLAHRLVLTPDARVNAVTKGEVIDDLLDTVPIPSVSHTTAPTG
jgi:MoxR-like ATPase